ncbi:2-oxo-4-hydroxy-4-carboxy-5-ureidoimidazoline decarboxylase-like [Anthonomus grandis grandis]|uniref:2-oxo-4-hydroxy-4-carboxy-5-ureidoimidazoline decarboxylase-like n=1 Tax=Anthonomus grandis grandis TaxID=2921223 RepID=UPI002165269D|nr:2-oxo-4-hydroxy-4-carboxy-5-ureidoimidazoline decarboxylase-like [Anthonomus grandis grandis]
MWAQYLSIPEVNNLESERFIKIFGNIVEHCLAAGIGILKNRPFGDVEDVVKAIFQYLDGLKLSEKEKILQLYPDSVSKLAGFSNSMLEFNTHQKIVNAAPTNIRFEDKKRLKQLSKNYKEKFGFPFILCSKDENIDNICETIESRMLNDKNTEIEVALEEVKKIAKLRIYEIIK